jgi:hypothetical protein
LRFVSTYCFYGMTHNQKLLSNKKLILDKVSVGSCPQQQNGYDCGLFGIGVVLHLALEETIHSGTFSQRNITDLRRAMGQNITPSDVSWINTMQVASFFPALEPRFPKTSTPPAPVRAPTNREERHVTNLNIETNEQDPEDDEVDFEDVEFRKRFLEPVQQFDSLEDVVGAVDEFEESTGIRLVTIRSDGLCRQFKCASHHDCPFRAKFGPLRGKSTIVAKAPLCTLNHKGATKTKSADGRAPKRRLKAKVAPVVEAVQEHTHGTPKPKDVKKAASNKAALLLNYNQAYRAVRTNTKSGIRYGDTSFQLIGPYLEEFEKLNPGSLAFMEADEEHCINRLFVCPHFMNNSVKYAKPVMSLDAAHMKSETRGTLYVASVVTALDEVYPVAIALTADNENKDGWTWFLENLDRSIPTLSMAHPRQGVPYRYFTFMSDRQKGLADALTSVFPENHSCSCAVHIARNVESRHGKKIARLVLGLASTSSKSKKDEIVLKISRSSEKASEYVLEIPPKTWLDSAWTSDLSLPPRFGIRTSNMSESANAMFGLAREKNWFLAIDSMLKKMALRVEDMRKKHREKKGIVEKVISSIKNRWEQSVGYQVSVQTTEGRMVTVYRNVDDESGNPNSCNLDTRLEYCDCGEWHSYGIPCVDAMAYFRYHKQLSMEQIIEQHVDKQHSYQHLNEMLRYQIVPVCLDKIGLDFVTKPPKFNAKRPIGRPKKLRHRKRSKYADDPGSSTIKCSRCQQRGHNVRSCVNRENMERRQQGDENPNLELL